MRIATKKSHLWSKKRIVAIGGGTGLSALLSGLKHFSRHLTGIVTVTDDGGSSGDLREEFNVLPPGDIRNCLVALADQEHLLSKLFTYRFAGKGRLKGHSFGNLFLTAMADLMGGFDRGIAEASKVLAIRGRVLPVTLEKVRLRAEIADGSVIYGESKISKVRKPISAISLIPIERPVPGPDVLKVIAEAHLIVIGPGSLFTSILPNLLVQGVGEAIANSSAVKIYVCNVMTQTWETFGFTAADHFRVISHALGHDNIDYIFLNSTIITRAVRKRYMKKKSVQVKNDLTALKNKSFKIRYFDFIRYDEVARHDSLKLAKAVLSVV